MGKHVAVPAPVPAPPMASSHTQGRAPIVSSVPVATTTPVIL